MRRSVPPLAPGVDLPARAGVSGGVASPPSTLAGVRPLFKHLTDRRNPESRKQALRSIALSAVVHAGLVALALLGGGRVGYALLDDLGTPTGVSDGPSGGGGGGGGGGGERVTYIDIAPAPAPAADEVTLTVPEPEPVPPPPEPEPQPVVPPPVPTPRPAVQAPAAPSTAPATGGQEGAGSASAGEGAGAGGGTGTGTGEGTGSGTGPGSGGGSGGGTGGGIGSGVGTGTGAGRIQAPVPEFVLLPPSNAPRSVRGDSLLVRLSIDASGKVRDVDFRSTGDRGYDQKLRRTALEWRFRPARDASNKPVAVEYVYALQF
ncbi:MAG TPA: hypothetical protein VGR37_15830 [Longimicrobiaceae bacterium]|nr:hypothetical protein [Longimicrobiaceae bacterium]